LGEDKANMHSAAAIRVQVETTLARRVPAALTLNIKQAPELFSTGMAEVDAMLVSGAASTGRTSFALSTLAKITQLGNACAWVDVNDSLSPESAAAAGVALRRLLWLRMSAQRRQRVTEKPWSRLEQALRATDLLLQTGGFAAIVLDMSDVLAQHTMRIPLATWYRFRLAAEHARSALLFLTQSPCASSCAALALRCDAALPKPFSERGETPLFEQQQYQLVRERNRNEGSPFQQKKPAGRVTWAAETQWTRCG
jgi:recA bacterial DNA recombination protein